jgi:endonuclease/exonuclease/phosphatase family metal-dependent hydrolase
MKTFFSRKRLVRWMCVGLVLVPGACASIRTREARRFTPRAPSKGELRLVTWNVGYFALSNDKNLRDVDLDGIVAVLKSTDPDVVVLQEVGEVRQWVALAERLGPGWTFHPVETGHQGQVLGLLTRLRDRERVVAEAGGRNLIGLSLRHPSGTDLFIAGVHAPHPARGLSDTRDSIRGALALLESRPEPVRIFAGDLNYHFDIDDPDSIYADLRGVLADSTLSVGDTYYAGTRIDHAFHYPREMEVVPDASGMIDLDFRWADVPGFRDHRPIVVTYALPVE